MGADQSSQLRYAHTRWSRSRWLASITCALAVAVPEAAWSQSTFMGGIDDETAPLVLPAPAPPRQRVPSTEGAEPLVLPPDAAPRRARRPDGASGQPSQQYERMPDARREVESRADPGALSEAVSYLQSCGPSEGRTNSTDRQKISHDGNRLLLGLAASHPDDTLYEPNLTSEFPSVVVVGIDLGALQSFSLVLGYQFVFRCKTAGCITLQYRESELEVGRLDRRLGPMKTKSLNSYEWSNCDERSMLMSVKSFARYLTGEGFRVEQRNAGEIKISRDR